MLFSQLTTISFKSGGAADCYFQNGHGKRLCCADGSNWSMTFDKCGKPLFIFIFFNR
jgi:hypothetical protein